jgi:alpha-beta hydrolase superfamily lysophospholipase
LKHTETRFVAGDDTELFARAWVPEHEPRALVVISHGLAEHGGRYQGLASHLVGEGYAVHAIDHRGHGQSRGAARANIERFGRVVGDLAAYIGRVQREHGGRRTFLLGHSMGGLVALACALRVQDSLHALVLSAPALAAGEAASPLRLLLARLLSAVAPGTGVLTLPASAVSRDPAVVSAYEQDPLVFRGSIPARTLVELLQAMSATSARVHELRLPVLLQHGSADQLVPLAAVQDIYQRLGTSGSRTLRVYDGLYHEVYNEPERERVIGDLVHWLDGLAPLA